MKLNDYIYVVNEYGKFLRKVIWKNEYYFEWNSGWATIEQLTPNEDNKSKVKFILYEHI
jgi:hypothetical protein